MTPVLDVAAVANVVTFIAPGFVALLGYRLRFPGPDRPAGEVLIISAVASLPLVAGISALVPGEQRPTQLGYVSLLLGMSLLLGYVAALVRDSSQVRSLLATAGYRSAPEGSIYAQTLLRMSDEGAVVIELKDGRRVWGCPARGPEHKDDGIAELYLTYPQALGEDGVWCPVGPGLIVPLAEVGSIALSEEPDSKSETPADLAWATPSTSANRASAEA